MRIIIIGALVILAVVVVIYGLKNQKRISFLTVALLLIPAGIAGYFEYNWQNNQAQISVSLQKFTGIKTAKLSCQRLSEGFFDAWSSKDTVDYGPTSAGLKYQECADLLSWYTNKDKSQPTENQMTAIHVLVREAMRIMGQADPSLQECYAMSEKNTEPLAEDLGATPDEARYIALYYQQHLHVNALKKPVQDVSC